jgi:HK97 family phage prohead protease
LEYKLIPAQVKLLGDGAGSLEGYASTFGNWDSVNERPAKGAFTRHLADFLNDGFIAIGHDWNALPIATPTEAKEDEHGLFVRADFHSTPEAQAARTVNTERIQRGKSVKLSIGYEVLDDEYLADGGRLLKEIKLYEWSVVTVPANQLAAVTGAKGLLQDGMTLDQQSSLVLAAAEGFQTRMKGLSDLRAKEGRILSDANRKRIASLKDALAAVLGDLDELLTATATAPKALSDTERQRLRAASMRLHTIARVDLGVHRP